MRFKKKFPVIFILLIFPPNAYSQKPFDRAYNVYLAILNELNISSKTVVINRYTDNHDLKNFHFKNPRFHVLDTSVISAINNKSWKTFLSQIDTATILDKQITEFNKVNIHKKIIIYDSKIDSKRKLNKDETSDYYGLIFFSSVIFSNDNQKAVCIFKKVAGQEDYYSAIFFLTFKNNKWNIVKNILLSIT